MAVDQIRDRLSEVLTTPLLSLGLDIEAIDVTPAGRRRILRVAVDNDGGVSLDDVAAATKEISRVLDASDAMGEQSYTLEVTSPGVDRPLTLPRHWRRNQGRLVAVTTAGNDAVTGRIVDADEREVVLDVGGQQQTLAYADVVRARVQVELNRPADVPRRKED